MGKTVLILGAGIGGITTARELSKNAGNDGEINPIKIIVFEKQERNVLGPLMLWLLSGKRNTEEVYRNTKDLAGDGIEVILGDIERVNPEDISVTVKGKVYRGDFMVVALGMDQKPYPPLNQFGYNLYSIEGAASLHHQLQLFKGGKVAIVVPFYPLKGPAAPYQAAMLMAGMLHLKERPGTTEIALYSSEYEPLTLAGSGLSTAVQQMLAKKGISYHSKHQLVSVSADALTFSNGKAYPYDLLAFTPEFLCPEVIRMSGLAVDPGCISADPHSLETVFPNVYAIGDNSTIALELGDLLPKAGTIAQKQAKIVAHNIAQKLFDENALNHLKSYCGDGELYIETGDGKASQLKGNFYTWPFPKINIKNPDYLSRWTKVWFEKYWWFKNF
jgi:sulfide:quinone oxidoreductase